MNAYQLFFSVLLLICVPVMSYLTRMCVADTMLEIGFSKDRQISKKRIARRNDDASLLERLLLIHILKKADQKRTIIWAGILWWWIVLLSAIAELCLGLCIFFIPDLFSMKVITLGAFVPFWNFGTTLSFHMYLVPQSRKDPGISDFECGCIALGVLVGGAVFLILYSLDLW